MLELSDKGSPIGIFDSGVGGLTVYRRLLELLPNERFVYLGDTARYPYGPRSAGIVTRFAIQGARFLLGFDVKLLVVACNTASSVALDALREIASAPVVGVILPGARMASGATKNGKVGVIGTVGTIRSGVYRKEISSLAKGTEIYETPCPLFVSLAEEGFFDGEIPEMVAHYYLDGLKERGIDTLVLGCTHYPLLKQVIGRVMGDDVYLVDSAVATAEEIADFLSSEGLASPERNGEDIIYVTDAPDRFQMVGKLFMEHPIDNVVKIEPFL